MLKDVGLQITGTIKMSIDDDIGISEVDFNFLKDEITRVLYKGVGIDIKSVDIQYEKNGQSFVLLDVWM